jgi:NAD(P)-dependent dehydrogenase (short-subunit alcohol dehydrogenase family)
MSVNLRGAFFLIQECTRRMLSCARRDLSVDPRRDLGQRRDRVAGPGGILHLQGRGLDDDKALAARLAPEGIGVFELRPGIIRTPMTGPVADRYDARIAEGLVPSGRWGEPSDIGKVIVPLARGDFDFATGAVIPVDGGLSIHRL